MKKKVEKTEKEEKAEKEKRVGLVQRLLFKRFKKRVGFKAFMVKYDGDEEKIIYNEALSELKKKNYLNYTLNFNGIHIFLTDIGRNIVDENEHW